LPAVKTRNHFRRPALWNLSARSVAGVLQPACRSRDRGQWAADNSGSPEHDGRRTRGNTRFSEAGGSMIAGDLVRRPSPQSIGLRVV